MKRKNIKITPKVFRFSSDKPTRIFPFQVISLIRPPGLPAEIADRRISRILLDCMKQLFSGYGKHKTTKKRACAQPLSFSHYLFIISPYTIWRNPYTFWQKNPGTQVHPLPNVKTTIKTQENNINFRPM